MNSIDAGSPAVEIMIGTKTFIVEDQGRGFQNKEEVMSYFKTFGAPHKEGRLNYARHIVAHAFMGLKNPEEQKELAVSINKESFSFLIDQKTNRFSR
ncbi:MAG: hypothetical protein GY710_26595 [Desulfobacteraceae bacterium]|nr:hypothetical protein [Desulfobacteraceae bacterium]